MTALVTTDLPAAPAARGRSILVATGFAVAGSIMFFAGLFGVYFRERAAVRAQDLPWIAPDATMELTSSGMVMWTLIISAAVMQWAVYSIARDDRRHALLAIGATLALGAMAIVQTAFQYAQMGLVIDAPPPSSTLIYTISGAHLAMLVIGMIFVSLMGFRALAGQYSSRQTDGIVAASIFWYATASVYFVLWIGVYIAK